MRRRTGSPKRRSRQLLWALCPMKICVMRFSRAKSTIAFFGSSLSSTSVAAPAFFAASKYLRIVALSLLDLPGSQTYTAWRSPCERFTGGGTAGANFSIATDETYKDKNGDEQKRTEWHK